MLRIRYQCSFTNIINSISQTCKFDAQNRITNIPAAIKLDPAIDHAPKRNHTLNEQQINQAMVNALKYFSPNIHSELRSIFKKEFEEYGHIYMFNYLPKASLKALPFKETPGNTTNAKAMIHMILNNLDPQVAQFPQELITYGGNGAVFQNWAQFHLTIRYLINMNENQTLSMYSGHPSGLFPKLSSSSPSAVITNGMMIPNYSSSNIYDNLLAMGTTMYGQMTAGSWMYIGPQGIVHGTTITVAQAAKLQDPGNPTCKGKIFVTSGLGGMSGAQPKAAYISGGICIVSEINEKALDKRLQQGWLTLKFKDLNELINRAKEARAKGERISLGYVGNVVDLWEGLAESDLKIDLGSDQSSCHNPFNGGYYPAELTLDESQKLMNQDPEEFKKLVQSSLRRHIAAINKIVKRDNMYFFDYGNAFLLEAERAGADVKENGIYRYRSYVEDIMGPEYFDFGFGPYRWACTSGLKKDLLVTDKIAEDVLYDQLKENNRDIEQQLKNNLVWIQEADRNDLTVGSQARIFYSDTEGRVECAVRMNKAIKDGKISAPIVLGRDHHDVSGTDSPYRETSNIYDGSVLTADMSIQNVIGDAMRGATWVSIHNGGGVGWGEVSNGGFGLVLDGSQDAEDRARSMLFWDVTNGLTRRARAGNKNAIATIKKLSQKYPEYQPFIPVV